MTDCMDCKLCKEYKPCNDEVVCDYVGCNVKYATRYGDCVAYKPKDEEADKVIAELEDKLQAANEQIENLINSASSIMLFQDRVKDDKCAELRHQKYKRCLAMAKSCFWKQRYWSDSTPGYERQFQWENRAAKWKKRWLELAEKFKETK